ncbi:MAG: segregation and condensation protein A [Gammaproteobacteria bacterium]|nr:segregation and condensation protein A [Gammaproteobacteria bacterium]MDH5613590.1 segregation and condensation protein A [Gammaproteobacteria bacterium]
MEHRILKAVKSVLVSVIKDTTTKPGLKHPLSDQTKDDIRHCLDLITAREKELNDEAGVENNARPHFIDEPKTKVVVSLDSTELSGKKSRE